jgi:hypothetical protein
MALVMNNFSAVGFGVPFLDWFGGFNHAFVACLFLSLQIQYHYFYFMSFCCFLLTLLGFNRYQVPLSRLKVPKDWV